MGDLIMDIPSPGKRFPDRLPKTAVLIITNEIQRPVDGDPVQPGGKTRISPEISGIPENLHKDILRQIFCVLPVMYDPQTSIYHHLLIAFDQYTE